MDTQVDPTALRKGETLVPFVESEGENPLGKVIVVGFRVGLPGAEKPSYEAQPSATKPGMLSFFFFIVFLLFSCVCVADGLDSTRVH